MLFQICGYKRHGKTTLANELCDPQRVIGKWSILHDPSDNVLGELWHFWASPKLVNVHAFASKLKIETHEFLRLKNTSFDTFEHVKETATFADPDDPSIVRTIRQWYIHVSKQFSRDHWVQLVFDSIQMGGVNIISDWRFTKELVEPAITIRVFREGIDIPLIDDESEHDLDYYKTRYVFFTGDTEYIKAKFPQYKDYVRSEIEGYVGSEIRPIDNWNM